MEPAINPATRAALYSPDAGNITPYGAFPCSRLSFSFLGIPVRSSLIFTSYEFTIAVAENAVDNGVSLRLRRQVTAISQDGRDGGTLTVQMDHWEPASYLDNKVDHPSSSPVAPSSSSSSSHTPPPPASLLRRVVIFIGATVSLAIISIALAHTVADIPSISSYISRTQAAVCAFVVAFSYVAVRFDGPAAASHLRLKSARSDDSSATHAAAHAPVAVMAKAAPHSVGSGGDCVPVADMAMGGSGFISAVGGRVVEKETVRTRWVARTHLPPRITRHTPHVFRFIVNCAGGYSGHIARMIGDDSFVIKPRLGEYDPSRSSCIYFVWSRSLRLTGTFCSSGRLQAHGRWPPAPSSPPLTPNWARACSFRPLSGETSSSALLRVMSAILSMI
jgi:hypothetical protein